MVQITIFFLFSSLSVGIYGHRQESQTETLAPVLLSRNTNDDSSTEQYLFINSEATDSSTGENWSTSSTNNPVTLNFNPLLLKRPRWRPNRDDYYVEIRAFLNIMANYDFQSKKVFDFFNRRSSLRTLIDCIFYSIERYRKDLVEGRSESAYETYPVDESSPFTDDQINDVLGKMIKHIKIDIQEFYGLPLGAGADTGVIGNINGGVLKRSGLLAQMAQEVYSQTEHSPTITADALIDTTPEELSQGNLESDDATPIVTACDTLGEVAEEDSTKIPEDLPDGTNPFTKECFRTRFPPIKTNTVMYSKTDDLVMEPYDVPVSQVIEPKLSKTSEQAEYKAAVASQAVEGALKLAETIARETAHLVNRIAMEALRHNVDKPIF